MIGYIQKGKCPEWQKVINKCIDNLSGKPDENGLTWSTDEYLTEIEYDTINRKYHGISRHSRKTIMDVIIHHLWVEMGCSG
jgi:hypothetical protein